MVHRQLAQTSLICARYSVPKLCGQSVVAVSEGPHWGGNPEAGVGSCREDNVFVVPCFVAVRLSSQPPSSRTSSVLVSCSPSYFEFVRPVGSCGSKPHLTGHSFSPVRGQSALHVIATTTRFALYTLSSMRMRLYPWESSSSPGTRAF